MKTAPAPTGTANTYPKICKLLKNNYIVSSSETACNQNIYSVLAVIFVPKIERKMILWQRKNERNIQNYQMAMEVSAFLVPADVTLMQSIHQQANTTLLPDR